MYSQNVITKWQKCDHKMCSQKCVHKSGINKTLSYKRTLIIELIIEILFVRKGSQSKINIVDSGWCRVPWCRVPQPVGLRHEEVLHHSE